MKKTWEGIRKIVNVKKMTSKPSQLNIDGKIIDDDKELATKFNNVFLLMWGLIGEDNYESSKYIPFTFF